MQSKKVPNMEKKTDQAFQISSLQRIANRRFYEKFPKNIQGISGKHSQILGDQSF